MTDTKLTYTFDDIVNAALNDPDWELPEEERFFLYGADAMLVIV